MSAQLDTLVDNWHMQRCAMAVNLPQSNAPRYHVRDGIDASMHRLMMVARRQYVIHPLQILHTCASLLAASTHMPVAGVPAAVHTRGLPAPGGVLWHRRWESAVFSTIPLLWKAAVDMLNGRFG